jgi:hypothetical protein
MPSIVGPERETIVKCWRDTRRTRARPSSKPEFVEERLRESFMDPRAADVPHSMRRANTILRISENIKFVLSPESQVAQTIAGEHRPETGEWGPIRKRVF